MSFLTRSITRRATVIARLGLRNYSEQPDRAKPVKFSTSEAANWRAAFTRRGTSHDDTPEAQTYIVCGSVAIFLAYFFFLREESDIDDRFDIFQDNLYERVDGLEEVNLRVQKERMLQAGLSVVEIEKRLEVLREERLKNAS
ncbi:uncharacterized protein LOC129001279 [Macrosteles quadrilineatus]|uniref:uncharacterized protein LOC129001279 n=1 Tax=Macrosteles quadrilineatus TaxID=74068 RepID=UPI0023E21210|nr:uncharacterized protein LOC129001279 [Macrosteles quadrilineatus]